MAAQVFQNNHEVSKREIQASIAKAMELRALHAALLHGNGPANMAVHSPASPPIQRSSNHLFAQDYPVFTPSYEDEQVPGYHQIQSENRRLSEILSEIGLKTGEGGASCVSESRKVSPTGRRGFSSGVIGREQNVCNNHITVLQTSPNTETLKSGRKTSLGEFKNATDCNTCNLEGKNHEDSTCAFPLTDSHMSTNKHIKNRGQILSWLFPKLKKKHKAEMSPSKVEFECSSQYLREWGIFTIENLKKQLLEANEDRDAALMEASQMKSCMEELKQKLNHLEKYCDELKETLNQAVPGKDAQLVERPSLSRRAKPVDGGRDCSMPVSHEAMVEGFLQIVSESRLSVKHFCQTLTVHIDETDVNLIENLNAILEPYNLTMQSKNSKGVLCHLESLTNQCFHQDFENCTFQKNGPQRVLDPQQDCQSKFSAFVSLRNLSWNEVLRKGTKYYSEEFSRFCDQKMGCIVSTLNWTRPWPEQLLQSFFIAAKCIWLLHLLAFSFNPPLPILRVDENQTFDSQYMEDVALERPRAQSATRVKIMIVPGFYIVDKVLRCKVLCRYRTVA